MRRNGLGSTASSPARRNRALVIARIAAAVLGGYAFSAVLVALLAILLPIAGMARSEAVLLASMLGFLIYLVVLIWAFAEPSVKRVWAVLPGGAMLAYALLRLIEPWLPYV